MVKGFVRCGICDIDFNSTEEWDKHVNGERHQKLVAIWNLLEMEARASNHHFLMKQEMIEARRLTDEVHITEEEMQWRLHKALEKLTEK